MTTPQTDPEVQARLRAAMAVNEQLLRTSLLKARSTFDHPGLKGDAVETAVRDFLRANLPRRFDIGQGEVIDRFGSRSAQHDVLVLTEDQPFVYEPGISGLYLCEGVAAVAEVKATMGTKELDDILKKGERYRTLGTTFLTNDTIMTNSSDRRRFYASAPFFGMALESSVATDTILRTLQARPEVSSRGPEGGTLPVVDALFVLDRGTFINYGDGQGALQYVNLQGIPYKGWVFQGETDVLVHLFIWLNAVAPRVQHWSSIATPYFVHQEKPTGGPE